MSEREVITLRIEKDNVKIILRDKVMNKKLEK
jgi:hypothetical protein